MAPVLEGVLLALVVIAAIWDVRSRRIPNWLTGTGLVVGLGLQAWLRGVGGVREAAVGAGLAFVVYFVFFSLRAMGAGDVKLMVAVGSLTGPSNWIMIFLLTSIIGGILAVILLIIRGTLLQTGKKVLVVLGLWARLEAAHRNHPELDVSHPNAVTLPHALSISFGTGLFLVLAKSKL
jgi:prepilin peptidase CpaA